MAETFINFEAIPAVREAVEREQLIRDLAFSGLPDRLCDIPVARLTFRHWHWLTIMESPFLLGASLSSNTIRGHIAAYFWTLAPHRPLVPKNTWLEKRYKKRFLRQVGKIETRRALAGIHDHLSAVFQDAPPTTLNTEPRASYYSCAATIIHRLATAYGWTDEVILDLPLTRLFQYLKIIDLQSAVQARKKPLQFNPSDALKGRLAAKIRQQPDCEEARLAVIHLN